MNTVNILVFGDIVGRLGRQTVRENIQSLKKEHQIHFTIANAENAAGGFGLTTRVYHELIDDLQIDFLTSGNHIWDKKDFIQEIEQCNRLIRPLNYPKDNPGQGWRVMLGPENTKIGIINVMGRVFMGGSLDDPFKLVVEAIEKVKQETNIVLLDVHAETTSEKNALAWYLNGQVSLIWGTHTHVQTSDERIFPGGTGFITDVGMTGSNQGVIGMGKQEVIQRFLTGRNIRMETIREGSADLCALVAQIDPQSGQCLKLLRVRQLVH